MEATIRFMADNPLDNDQVKTLQFRKLMYENGNTAIQLWSDGQPYARLTVNLGPLKHDYEAYFDRNGCPYDVLFWLRDQGFVKIIEWTRRGYNTYPLMEFSREFMNLLEEDDG